MTNKEKFLKLAENHKNLKIKINLQFVETEIVKKRLKREEDKLENLRNELKKIEDEMKKLTDNN